MKSSDEIISKPKKRIFIRPVKEKSSIPITEQIGSNLNLLYTYQQNPDYFWLNYDADEITRIQGINPKLRFKLLLTKFWLEIGSEGKSVLYRPEQISNKILDLLHKFHKLNISWDLVSRKFNLKKQLIRKQIIHKKLCFICYKTAGIRYFIIPVIQSGPADVSNIIYLCKSHGWKIIKYYE